MDTPLDGITVIDMSRALAGPWAAMTLGDLGANVIKVEDPRGGDVTRGYPPFWNGHSTYYMSANRNKRSITVNLESQSGRELVRSMIANADIVIESFRTGAMETWGLGWDELHELNPRLIYCAVSAVGRDGPDKDRAGVDLLMQAYAGLMSITGESGRAPVRTGTSVVDLTTGANAVQGILAALYVRRANRQWTAGRCLAARIGRLLALVSRRRLLRDRRGPPTNGIGPSQRRPVRNLPDPRRLSGRRHRPRFFLEAILHRRRSPRSDRPPAPGQKRGPNPAS